MTKILLVEDDKSLREIYGVRLVAEGYQIISAGDGEQALALAVKEKPDLIISDVMMPKISGFDMLDILRSTPETRELKVIMMTALSSEEQRSRGENLGANRYLVKSQVGIEDVVRAVHDILADAPIATAPASQIFSTPNRTAATYRPPQPSVPASTNTPQPTTPIDTAEQTPQPTPTEPTPQSFVPPAPIEPTPQPTPVEPAPQTEWITTTSAPEPLEAPRVNQTPIEPTTPAQPTQPAEPQLVTPQDTILANNTPQLTQFDRPTVAPTPYSPPELSPQGDKTINPVENSQPNISDLMNKELNNQPQPPVTQ